LGARRGGENGGVVVERLLLLEGSSPRDLRRSRALEEGWSARRLLVDGAV
jgi:hypothetical protein